MSLERPKPQSGAGCGANKARSGRQVNGPELVAALALLGSGGAQPESVITQARAQRTGSLDWRGGDRRKPLAPRWTKPRAGRHFAPAQATAAMRAADIRRVIRREQIPELSCIAVVEPVIPDYEIGTPQQIEVRVPSSSNRRHGLIATTMRGSGEYSPLARRAHRTTNRVQQWRPGRRPSMLTVGAMFELRFKNYGKPMLNRPRTKVSPGQA